MNRTLVSCLVIALLWSSSSARAQVVDAPVDLELLGDLAYLTDGDSHGGALDAGLRLGLGPHFALGFDVGYGVIGSAQVVEDRWWIMPTAAFVVRLGPTRLDLGAGIGVGAASGYADLDAFLDAPFDPDWAFQLAPAVRGHAMLAWAIDQRAAAFVRLEAGALLVDGNELGIREETNGHGTADTLWVAASFGVAIDLLEVVNDRVASPRAPFRARR